MRNKKLEHALVVAIIIIVAIILFFGIVLIKNNGTSSPEEMNNAETTEVVSDYVTPEVPGVTVEAEDSTNTMASEISKAKESDDYSSNNNFVEDGPSSLKDYWDYTCTVPGVSDADILNVPTSLGAYYVYTRDDTSSVVACCKALSLYLGTDINSTVTTGNIEKMDYTFGTTYYVILKVDNINYLIYKDDTNMYIKAYAY